MSESSSLPLSDRIAAVVVVGVTVAVVWLLTGVDPDARGFGTHEQLGLTPCSWPDTLGIPCPTCGCTTAAAHIVHLSPWRALVVQPFGALLAAGGIALGGVALYSLIRGRLFLARIAMWPYPKIFLGSVAVLLLAWLYKYLTWEA